MGKFNEYTQKATPEDADSLMIYDAAAKANKLSPFSGIWNWIVGKLTNAVISKLETQNKSVIGALNELNSKSFSTYATGDTSQVILPVNGGGATVMIAYTLGPSGFDGENVVITLFRYDYDGTKCSIDYIFNYGNNIIETSISNNKNTITFKKENVELLRYLRVVYFVI